MLIASLFLVSRHFRDAVLEDYMIQLFKVYRGVNAASWVKPLTHCNSQLGALEGTGEYFLVKSQPNSISKLTSSPTESSTSGTPYQLVSPNRPQSTSSRTDTIPSSRLLLLNWTSTQFLNSIRLFLLCINCTFEKNMAIEPVLTDNQAND